MNQETKNLIVRKEIKYFGIMHPSIEEIDVIQKSEESEDDEISN